MNETKILGISMDPKTANVITNVAVFFTAAYVANLVLKYTIGFDLFAAVRGAFSTGDQTAVQEGDTTRVL